MGKGKGGKGKEEWKGKGGKGRYDRYFKGEGRGPHGSQFAGVPAPLLAVPQFADGSWGKELSGGLHAFDRGHILFSTKELYFEVLGQCSVHLAVPAPTKIDGRDRQEFASSGPVELAGRSFRNLQELRSEIVTLRKAHSNPPRRLEPEAERLMRSVFEHHPQATEKLKDLQFIQVASNPQSEDPTDVTFFVMRNEQDGDDISYVKCLRAMVTKEGEQMLPLATLSHDHGLHLRVASSNVQIGPSSQGFGVRVDLERLALSVLLTEGLRGPWQLELGRQHSDLPHVPLRVVVEVPEGEAAVIRWAAPFDFAPQAGQELALPALEDQWKSEELKKSLEAMMKDQNIPGDLSSLSMEELQRIALQIVVKSLGASLHVTRSAGACVVQNQSLLRIAREQGMELTCQQLQDARTELQKVKEERDTAEATLNQLREEMAVLRRKVTQVEGERQAPVVPDVPRRAPQAAGGAVEAAAELEELRRKLQAELPDPAGSMLRNSLKLMSSELYSGPSRALWELLQNADDCSYDQEAEMQIEQIGNDLWIEYNERGFSWEDVEALCSLGSSTKGIAQTGEKGVGFKSAFVLSSRPHILSNPYRFFFDETASCPLPHVTPQRLLEDTTLPRHPPERGTAVYLPLRKDFPELLNEIVPESLLFLRRLHHVSVGHQSFSLRHENGHSTLLVADSSGTQEYHYIIARVQELAIAFPLAAGGPALLSATLPIHRLEGLKTPLNAPFELTANREALRENSQRNVELRDALAELFLQAAAEHEILSSKVWQLQPDAEGGGFWAPFVQRVRAGLQEVPLIPVIPGTGRNRWALKRCRNPSSELLRELNLSPSDLEKVGLAIPTEEFLRQLPEGSDFNLPEFDATDLLGLLQCGDISTTWRSYGNEWRQRVVGALERRLSEVDLATLRSVALFPTGADDWSSFDDQIYLSLPEGAPEGLLKALHSSRACAADRALLTATGGGAAATHRDVAYAVLQRGLGLADVEDRRFSWSHLAYLGHHWQSILQSGAADEWLAKQTPEQMEELLRSMALPSCSGRLLHCASELRCPFLLGCKSSATDRSNLLAEPPGANDIQARLRWELVFLRLGAQMAEDQRLQLPRNFFAEGVGKELRPLLEHYEQLGVLQTIRKKCCIPDRTGYIGQAGLLGPAFQPLLGPDGIVDVADDCTSEASKLLGIVVTPTALLVAQMLERAAQGGTETLRRSYEFLSAEWREGRVDEETLLTLKNGMWMLNCEGELSFEQVADVTWEDVQRQISLWPKDGLHGIFRALGVSPSASAEAATPPAASQPPANGQKGSGERPQAKSSSQLLTWPALPQVRAMAEDGGPSPGGVVPVGAGNSGNPPPFREPSGAQLPLLGKLLQQIFYSAGGDGMLYGRLGKETREMLASDIHFTQNSISRRFGHGELKGRQVEDVAKALREGNMTTKDLPLVVVKFESNYYTLNNRSLYALRKASRAQKPLRAQVAAFESMCPVTAKFIQLRCSSLAGQDESLARATNSSDEEA